jgi:hypothetical protein
MSLSDQKENYNNYASAVPSSNTTQQPITQTSPPLPASLYPGQGVSFRSSDEYPPPPPPSYIQTQNVYQTFQVPVIVPFGLFSKSPQHMVH